MSLICLDTKLPGLFCESSRGGLQDHLTTCGQPLQIYKGCKGMKCGKRFYFATGRNQKDTSSKECIRRKGKQCKCDCIMKRKREKKENSSRAACTTGGAVDHQISSAALRAEILRILQSRGPGQTCCPSEVPRRLLPGGNWRDLMDDTRSVAVQMVHEGILGQY